MQKKYARKSRCRNTLVIEPIGSFFELIDPAKDTFRLDDPMLKQLKCLIENQICIVLIKIWPQSLVQQLIKLTKYYEIVVFTILPRDIMN